MSGPSISAVRKGYWHGTGPWERPTRFYPALIAVGHFFTPNDEMPGILISTVYVMEIVRQREN